MPKQWRIGATKTRSAGAKGKAKKGKAKDEFAGFDDDDGESAQPFSQLKWRTVPIDSAIRGEAGLVGFEEIDSSEIAHLLPNKPAPASSSSPKQTPKNKRKRGGKDASVKSQEPNEEKAAAPKKQKRAKTAKGSTPRQSPPAPEQQQQQQQQETKPAVAKEITAAVDGNETKQAKRARKRREKAAAKRAAKQAQSSDKKSKKRKQPPAQQEGDQTTEGPEEQPKAKKSRKARTDKKRAKPVAETKDQESSSTSAEATEDAATAPTTTATAPGTPDSKPQPDFVPAIVPMANVEDWKRKWGRLKSWQPYRLHPSLMEAIKEFGLFSPTPIQERALTAALLEDKDVVGIAETGSGKTLAYGLPILHKIARKREQEARTPSGGPEPDRRLKALLLAPTRELAVQVSDQLKLIAKHTSLRVVPVIGGLAPQKQIRLLAKKPEVVVATPGRLWELINEGNPFLTDLTGLEFLVIDEADRMVETGHFRELKSILTLVQHPASRELIALPATAALGRVLPPTEAEIQNGEDDSQPRNPDGDVDEDDDDDDKEQDDVDADDNVKEEEDVEDGEQNGEDDDDEEEDQEEAEDHEGDGEDEDPEQEGEENGEDEDEDAEEDMLGPKTVVEPVPGEPEKEFKRQTFIFSATLTLAPQGRAKLGPKPSTSKLRANTNALAQVSKLVGFERQRKVIDLTTKKVVVSTLEEAVIQCLNEEKDYYLYYFSQQHKGRTLVFCNSIACIRRLLPLLTILGVPAWGLHASMQQRQRLKNLERFRNSKESILIATDVAARGLDIPLVDHVIHYQLPRTVELYVHRSGRTARATASGLSVMLVGPEDMKTYRQICSVLRNGREVEPFTVDRGLLPRVAKRVNLARKVDAVTHEVRKKKSKKDWFQQAAEEMDIDVDDDILSEEDEESAEVSVKKQREIEGLRAQLSNLLSQPLLPRGGFTTFFTRSLLYDPNKLSAELNKVVADPTKAAKKSKSSVHRRKGRK